MTTWFFTNSGANGGEPKQINGWDDTSNVAHHIFDRVASYFRHFELDQKIECFTDRGCAEPEIDLTDISKESFNIFYLRFKEAFDNYPDMDAKARDIKHQEYIIYQFKHILAMLKNDIRHDSNWIKKYQIETVMVDCFGYET